MSDERSNQILKIAGGESRRLPAEFDTPDLLYEAFSELRGETMAVLGWLCSKLPDRAPPGRVVITVVQFQGKFKRDPRAMRTALANASSRGLLRWKAFNGGWEIELTDWQDLARQELARENDNRLRIVEASPQKPLPLDSDTPCLSVQAADSALSAALAPSASGAVLHRAARSKDRFENESQTETPSQQTLTAHAAELEKQLAQKSAALASDSRPNTSYKELNTTSSSTLKPHLGSAAEPIRALAMWIANDVNACVPPPPAPGREHDERPNWYRRLDDPVAERFAKELFDWFLSRHREARRQGDQRSLFFKEWPEFRRWLDPKLSECTEVVRRRMKAGGVTNGAVPFWMGIACNKLAKFDFDFSFKRDCPADELGGIAR